MTATEGRGSFWRDPTAVLWLLIGAAAFYVAFTLGGRGSYVDEWVQGEYGKRVVRWYTSGFSDRGALDFGNLILYGGLVEALFEAVAAGLPFDRLVVRHALVALFAVATALGTYRLAVLVRDPWTGVLAVALLLASPRFLGHAFFNSKDIPFAALYVWALVLFVRDVRRPVGSPIRAVLPLALVLGAVLGTRIGGAIVFAPILAGYTVRWWRDARTPRGLVTVSARFSLAFPVAWGFMLVGWPWAQQRPFMHPLVALLASSDFPFGYYQLFGGSWVYSLELPWQYVPTWFAISSPEIVLLGLLCLVGVTLARRRDLGGLLEPGAVAVVTAGVLPVVYVVARNAALYDGLRHLLFVQPFVVLAAAVGLIETSRALSRRFAAAPVRPAALTVLLIGLSMPLATMFVMRPYEYVYFNHASGGLRAAEGRFELEYWGLGYREGIEWLDRQVDLERSLRVATCSHPGGVVPFVSERMDYVGSPLFEMGGEADYLVYNAPHKCVWTPPATLPPGRVIHTVTRQGVPLLNVLALDEPMDSTSVRGGQP